jgi:hypothetical protein
MVKIYRVTEDVDRYQILVSAEDGLWSATGPLHYDCSSKKAAWSPPRFRIYNPQAPSADFIGGITGALVVRRVSLERVRTFFELAGEILPIDVPGQDLCLLNITDCVDCLDPSRTRWVLGETTHRPIRVAKYAFDPKLLPGSSLFKIPQTARGEVLTWEGRQDPDDEFKPFVESNGLTGLKFELLDEEET